MVSDGGGWGALTDLVNLDQGPREDLQCLDGLSVLANHSAHLRVEVGTQGCRLKMRIPDSRGKGAIWRGPVHLHTAESK